MLFFYQKFEISLPQLREKQFFDKKLMVEKINCVLEDETAEHLLCECETLCNRRLLDLGQNFLEL